MKKKYELSFKDFDDLKKYLKDEFGIEFKPPIRVKTVFVELTEEELTTARGAYNAEAQEALED